MADTLIHPDLVPKKYRSDEWTNGMWCLHFPEALWACCCPCFVSAAARRWHDGTSWFFNVMCVSPCLVYQLIRTENFINGSSCTDILESVFCYPCAPVRALREARTRAPAAPKFYGGAANYWDDGLCDCTNNYFSDLFWAIVCMPCASATVRTRLDGSPWCFNFLCTTPCAVRSLVRRKHLVHGDECIDGILPCVPFLNCLDMARLLRYTEARVDRRDYLSRFRRTDDMAAWTHIPAVGGRGREAVVFGPALVCGQMTENGTRCHCPRTREEIYMDGGRCTCLHPMHQHPSEAQVARCAPPFGVHDSARVAGVGGVLVTEQNHPEENNVLQPELVDLQMGLNGPPVTILP